MRDKRLTEEVGLLKLKDYGMASDLAKKVRDDIRYFAG